MIYVKTDAGRQALKERAESMPRKYHFPFLMCDGVRDAESILQANAVNGFTMADLEHMLQIGFIAPLAVSSKPASALALPSAEVSVPEPTPSHKAEIFIEAQQMATAMTAKLGLRGFMLNMAVESAHTLEALRELMPKIEAAVSKAEAERLAKLLKSAGV